MVPLLLGLIAALAAPQDPAPTPLFDGRTLDGWSGDPRFWSVEDGAIVGRSTAEVPCERTTYLVLGERPFADFDVSLEFWIDGGNSGLQFRSARTQEWQVAGYQADLEDGPNWTGGLYEQDGRGVLVRRGEALVTDGETRAVTALGDAAELAQLGAPRAWHTYRVRAVGPLVELFIDGTPTARLEDTAPFAGRSGVFALQMHQGPPMEVRFRNIVVRDLGGEVSAPAASPQWIWHPDGVQDGQLVRLERALPAGGAVTRATLFATCDNGVEVALDGETFAAGEAWDKPFEIELPEALLARLGDGAPHVLGAECWNEGGPAGFLARLTVERADGSTEEFVTDRRWRSTDGRAAIELGALGVAPWGTPAGRSNGSPSATLPAEALEIPPGFEAELMYSVPRAFGSWVALTVDGRGRLIAAAEARHGLFRLTLDGGRVTDVEPLGLDIGGAHGLEVVGDDLYVIRNEWQSDQNGLYRARDLDGDDRFDECVLLQPIDGGGEHGTHAVRLTPRGDRLQVIAGNAAALPSDIARSHVLRRWSDDQILPSMNDTFGHGNEMHLHGGWTATCDLDGKDWELVATGMRNAYDFAYDAEGNAFTYDSDMEWDMGAPWYRAPRVLHLAPGLEFGWRRGSGKIVDDAPETFGAVCDTGPASPVGVLHGKDGAFHPPFGDALFIGDWTRGRVLAVTLEPDRGTFVGTPKPFVQGRPFPVTDMAWLPDGSMVIAIGGRGGRTGLYRIRSTVERGARDVESLAGLIAEGPLADRMRRAAYEAQSDVEAWAPRVLAERDAQGLLALARAGGKPWQPRLLEAVLAGDEPLDVVALRVIELSIARDGEPEPRLAARVAERIAGSFASQDARRQVAITEMLVRLGSERAPALAVPRMLAAASQEEALDFAAALRLADAGWTSELARTYLDFLHTDAHAFRGGRSVEGYVDRIRAAALERAGAAVPGYAPPERPAVAARPIEATFFVKEWRMDELIALEGEIARATNREAGERAFRRANCFTCHRVGHEGAGTGPDLTDAGARFGVRDLLVSLLEPSRDVSDQYRDTEVWTTDGEVFVGRPVEAEDGWIALQEAHADGAEGSIVEIPRSEVKLQRPSPLSRMPSGLLDVLQKEEIVEMLAWILADKR